MKEEGQVGHWFRPGVDTNHDLDLAMAIRVSREEQRARQRNLTAMTEEKQVVYAMQMSIAESNKKVESGPPEDEDPDAPSRGIRSNILLYRVKPPCCPHSEDTVITSCSRCHC